MSTQAPLVTAELKGAIGTEVTVPPQVVELGVIKEFAKAIAWPNPPNPLYTDEAYARKTRYRGIIAPPTFFTRLNSQGPRPQIPLPPCKVQVNGGHEFEILGIIRPGDSITLTRRFADVYERQGRKERMLFVIYDYIYTNQLNEVVGKCRFTAIRLY